MAKLPDNIDLDSFNEWLKDRPIVIQEMAQQCPPDRLYLLKTTGQRVSLLAYSEDRTVRVDVSAVYNRIVFEREVFGVKIDDLEECDIPSPEQCGFLFQ